MAKINKSKKIKTIEEYLKELSSVRDNNYYLRKYSKSLDDAKADKVLSNKLETDKTRTSNYSLRTKILKNPWIKSAPYSKALRWLHREVFKDPKTYKYNKLLLKQGRFYTFEYKDPKYKGTKSLPWFDMYPLVISLGPVVTNLGVRNLGLNLHLLPPKVRVVVICSIFELYKRHYRYQIYNKTKNPIDIRYQNILKHLWRYGIGFCVRLYIPKRIRQIVEFP